MSKAAVATDPFVPFGPETLSGGKSAAGAANLRVVPKDAAGTAFSPFQPVPGAHTHGPTTGGSGQPKVTLQKEGDKVVGIRVECGCGQVIELTCSY